MTFAAVAAPREFIVRLASPEDRSHVERLVGEMMPGVDISARWRWLYETNPGGEALTWLVVAPDGEVAGCTSFFPFRVWLDGTEIRAALGGDGFVRPAYRRNGLGGMLHEASRRAMEPHGIACMYGAPGAMNVSPLKRGGSREVGDVTRWVRPLRVGGGVVGDALGALLRPSGTARLEPMAPHDERVDRVWEAARTELRVATVRDAAFYTWRFLEAPGYRQHAFVIAGTNAPIGMCALETIRGGQTVRIVDLLAVPGAWHDCLRAIARHASLNTDAHVLDIKLMDLDGRRRRMWASAFRARESKPFLCMLAPNADRRLVDPTCWFYGGADSDLPSLAE